MAKLDLNEDAEKENIETIYWSAMDILSDDDKKLPQARFCTLASCINVICLNRESLANNLCCAICFSKCT